MYTSLSWEEVSKQFNPGGGGVDNMLRVRVCAAHMGGILGPKGTRVPFSANFPQTRVDYPEIGEK